MLRNPLSPRIDHFEWYQHFAINDPYRWLENITANSTQRWCQQQTVLTKSYLSGIAQRASIKRRLEQLSEIDIWKVLDEAGPHRLLVRTNGSSTSDEYYVRNLHSGCVRLLFDPQASPDHKRAWCGSYCLSPKGTFVAYAVLKDGVGPRQWRIRDVATAVDLDLTIEGACVGWLPDESGLYYTISPVDAAAADDSGNPIKLGFRALEPAIPPCALTVRGQPGEVSSIKLSNDGRYLVLVVNGNGKYSSLRIICLGQDSVPFEPFENPKGQIRFAGGNNHCLWFHSEDGAPKGKVVAVRRCRQRWQIETVVPEQPDTLLFVHFGGQRLLLSYLRDGVEYLQVCTLRGHVVRTIEHPGIGEITDDRFVNDQTGRHILYDFSGLVNPPVSYRLSLDTGRTTLASVTITDFDSSAYVSHLVFARGKYGAKIPVKICHRRDLNLNGSNPTILSGYGANNYNLPVAYSPRIAAWLEMGGIWAVAAIRGGGEGGQEWASAGNHTNKQNSFNDFIAAAEHLISANYTCPKKLAITGASAGGMLVAACITQRPELFGAAVLFSPSIDVLRFAALNPRTTNDRGSVAIADECEAMIDYAPLLNMRPGGHYPQTLVCAREADTRVSPAHAYKFVAALQHVQQDKSVCLLRIEPGAGHYGPEDHDGWINEASDWLAFVANALSGEEASVSE